MQTCRRASCPPQRLKGMGDPKFLWHESRAQAMVQKSFSFSGSFHPIASPTLSLLLNQLTPPGWKRKAPTWLPKEAVFLSPSSLPPIPLWEGAEIGKVVGRFGGQGYWPHKKELRLHWRCWLGSPHPHSHSAVLREWLWSPSPLAVAQASGPCPLSSLPEWERTYKLSSLCTSEILAPSLQPNLLYYSICLDLGIQEEQD